MRKTNEKSKKKNNKGITLIALVITIIVLLILAGVSIAMLTGENGILTQAQNAKDKTDEAQEKEKIQLAITASQLKNTDNNITTNYDNLKEELEEQFGTNFSLRDNKDDTFLITINNSQRMYYVNEDGKVIDNSSILKITSEGELINFKDEVKKGNSFDGKAVILMNDITLSENWTPIGYISDDNIIKFNGDFNGLNHKINNLTINNPQKLYQGVFANTGSSAKINSLVVTGSITGGKYVGAIVGYNEGSIRNCGNEASVTCQYDVSGDWNPYSGGIAGYNYNGTINGCYNEGEVSSSRWSIGGIVGKSEGGTIKNSYNSSLISSEGGETAGICGVASNTTLYNLYNTGVIQANISNDGGITGILLDNANIRNTYNCGQIQGSGNVGGISGQITESAIVKDCYNKANIICEETAAGIIGQGNGHLENVTIKNCYHYGNVETPGIYRGTIIGQVNLEKLTQNCEWYTDDQEYYNSMIGKTTIKFNENIDMKNVLEVVNGENFFISDGDNNNPKLYWE